MNEQKVKVAHKRGMHVGEAAIWCMKRYEHTKNIYWWRVAQRIARRSLHCSVNRHKFYAQDTNGNGQSMHGRE